MKSLPNKGLHLMLVGSHEVFSDVLKLLSSHDNSATLVPDTGKGTELLDSYTPDIVLLAIEELRKDHFEFVRKTQGKSIQLIVAGPDNDFLAHELSREGVKNYAPYPPSRVNLAEFLNIPAAQEPARIDDKRLHGRQDFADFLVSQSVAMRKVFKQIRRVAPTQAPVLITGESGTGKEITAQSIHQLSARKEERFLAVNCGAIAPQLIESELFGHVKGSFTGATRDRKGFFELANKGTLFLDEITEMSLELQVNLLRVLETGLFTPVGGTAQLETDVRVLAATNRDLRAAISEGYLREDLLYRIQVFPIHLPALRERTDDIVLLARHFLDAHNRREKTHKHLSGQALEALKNYSWPGNVRELKNVIYRAYIMADKEIGVDELPSHLGLQSASHPEADIGLQGPMTLAEVEKRHILATLARCQGKKEKAAKLLGIAPKTLYNRLRSYGKQRD